MNGRGPAIAGRDSAIGAYRTEVHPYRTQYITYHEKTLRLQIAITAVCSLKIYQIALNASVKDRKVLKFCSLPKFSSLYEVKEVVPDGNLVDFI